MNTNNIMFEIKEYDIKNLPLTREELEKIQKEKQLKEEKYKNEPMKFCNRCKKDKYEIEFYNKDGVMLKSCHKCRVVCNKYTRKYMSKKRYNAEQERLKNSFVRVPMKI